MENFEESASEGSSEDTFSMGDARGDVQAGVEALRTRLLDLTLANRLINFKQSSPRVLRVIDELPDQLFRRLLDSKELELRPVPPPPPSHPLYGAFDQEAPRKERQKACETIAVEIGLATSFELPTSPPPGVGAMPRHSDDAIQTLLAPQDLERALRAISGDAKSALEEKGGNILYLVFGFLQWYESPDSDRAICSPLVMMPVTLRRAAPDKATGAYRYYVSARDDDTLPNTSLQEKMLRDFRLNIPDFEPEDTPDSYFAKFTAISNLPSRWKVQRQISLGLLSFTKLFMYRDLEPEKWPNGKAPSDHPLIRQLFRGGSEGVHAASEYNFETDGAGGAPLQMPPLIVDADSSQLSAIVDVMAGRNLVIEGPPGTGKSQTIANMIAALLGAGKSVLFVADKLTALEVVRRRLDEQGLGSFCLEIHSDKTQKSRVVEDLRNRRALCGKFRDPSALDERLRSLDAARVKLNAYATLMNSTFGALHWRTNAILWGTRRHERMLGAEAAATWRSIRFPNVEAFTLDRFDAMLRSAAAYGDALAELQRNGGLRHHPFFGWWPHELHPTLEVDLERGLRVVHRAAAQSIERVRTLERDIQGAGPQDTASLAEWLRSIDRLLVLGQGVDLGLVRLMGTPKNHEALSEWLRAARAWKQRDATVRQYCPLPPNGDVLRAMATADTSRLRPDLRISDLSTLPELSAKLLAALRSCDAIIGCVAELLDDPSLPRTLQALQLSGHLLRELVATPTAALTASAQPVPEQALPSVMDGAARAAALIAEREQLARTFQLNAVSEPASDLELFAVTCANAGIFSFLNASYRRAKNRFVFLTGIAKPTNDQMATGYRALALYGNNLKAFESDPRLAALLGIRFRGLDTDFKAILQAHQWRTNLRMLQQRHLDVSPRVSFAGNASQDALRKAIEFGMSSSIASTLALIDSFAGVLALTPTLDNAPNLSLSELRDVLASMSAGVTLVSNAACNLGVNPETTLLGLRGLCDELSFVVAERERIELSPEGRSLAAAGFTLDMPLERLENALRYVQALLEPGPEGLQPYVAAHPSPEDISRLRERILELEASLLALSAAETGFSSQHQVVLHEWYGTDAIRSAQAVFERTEKALRDLVELPPWTAFLRERAKFASAGGGEMRTIIERDASLDPKSLPLAVKYLVYASLSIRLFEMYPAIREHGGVAHSELRRQFAEYDQEVMRLQRERLAAQIDLRPVPEGKKGALVSDRTELALIDHELTKQRAHVPIRKLIERASKALRALKPCFMMSPRSVAEYLNRKDAPFDVLIMDEASQVRPEDAIGACLRANQHVIVGDSKQLPPTSFFAGGGPDPDAEETFSTDYKESILDAAKSAFGRSRQLRWHYRSKHGSLIAFSNQQYYDNSLIVFPSPVEAGDTRGVKFIHVKDGVYCDQKNLVEAERVADAVIDHLRQRPHESFGVVAMNIRQKELLEGLILDRLKNEPSLRQLYDRSGQTEPPFIKNLESVQGDERDVIFISVTYGPGTPGGQVLRRFGPLNGAFGSRRLNVLFTRAKHRVVVVSSFLPDALTQPGSSPLSRGASDLQKYLEFARTGKLQAAELSDREPDSEFEREVADVLRNEGYRVAPQVGVSGYYIDMAVRHPRIDSAFILGIECDGAAYHSTFSARDRDRLRQQVLEGLGWRLHRIWSTDWYHDPQGQRRKLLEAVERSLIEESRNV